MIEQPAQARYSVDYDGSSLRIKIPSRKRWFQIIFTIFWLIFWSLFIVGGMSSFIAALIVGFTAKAQGAAAFSIATMLFPIAFMLFIFLFILAIGLFAIYSLLWQIIGYEAVEVTPLSLSITRKVARSGKPKIYDAGSIKDLRVSPDLLQSSWMNGGRSQFWQRNTGTLAFDYGAKTIRFGDMEEGEAKMLLAEILRRYPNYGKRS